MDPRALSCHRQRGPSLQVDQLKHKIKMNKLVAEVNQNEGILDHAKCLRLNRIQSRGL